MKMDGIQLKFSKKRRTSEQHRGWTEKIMFFLTKTCVNWPDAFKKNKL